jgi:hypothetical protein
MGNFHTPPTSLLMMRSSVVLNGFIGLKRVSK